MRTILPFMLTAHTSYLQLAACILSLIDIQAGCHPSLIPLKWRQAWTGENVGPTDSAW